MKKVLVLGYKGFIGSGLYEFFESRGPVVGWGREENIFNLDPEKLQELEVDLVVNCAVETDRSTPYFIPGSRTDEINVQGARYLAKILKGSNIGWIQISTKDVFGPVYRVGDVTDRETGYYPKFLVDDVRPYEPQTNYAKSKLMSEFIAESYSKSTVIRLSSCYIAHGHKRANWIVNMIRQISKGEVIHLSNGGKQFRDPLYVDDLGRLIESVRDNKRWGLKMNAGGGPDNVFSILEVALMIDPRVKYKKVPGDDYGFAFNNRLATEGNAWRPTVKLQEYMPELIRRIKSELERV